MFPDIVDTIKSATHYYSPDVLAIPMNFICTIEKIGSKSIVRNKFPDNDFRIQDHHLSDTTNKSIVNRTGLSIVVDTTREVSIDKDRLSASSILFYPPDDENHPKSKTQLIIDSVAHSVRMQVWEESKTFVKGFPVYILNNSGQSIRVEEEDARLMIIQEALDTSGQWKPIEFWPFGKCGSGYSGIALPTGYLLMTTVYKYKGNFETLLRLKMLNDTVIYYSQPFRGSINLSQMDTSLIDYKFRPREFFVLNKDTQH